MASWLQKKRQAFSKWNKQDEDKAAAKAVDDHNKGNGITGSDYTTADAVNSRVQEYRRSTHSGGNSTNAADMYLRELAERDAADKAYAAREADYKLLLGLWEHSDMIGTPAYKARRIASMLNSRPRAIERRIHDAKIHSFEWCEREDARAKLLGGNR
jgi:hypothetical protein